MAIVLSTVALPTVCSSKTNTFNWWSVTSDDGFFITDVKQKKYSRLKETTLIISSDAKCLSVNGHRMSPRILYVEPVKDRVHINGVERTGVIKIDGAMLSSLPHYTTLFSDDTSYDVSEHDSKKMEQLEQIDTTQSSDVSPVAVTQGLKIRVLLDEILYPDSLGSTKKRLEQKKTYWFLSSEKGFFLWDPQGAKKKIHSQKDGISIQLKNGNIYINKQKFLGDKVYVTPQAGNTFLGTRSYNGSFLIAKDSCRLMLINCVELEDYVFSVLRTESWPGWPLEVNKVFAIASRTYALAMAMRAKKSKKPYHLKNTNEHQTYSGMHTCAVIKSAVEETRGVFISYNNQPIIAMFDSCCGGVIPAHIADFNFEAAPYLAREYACLHCKECRLYAWQAEFALHDLEHLINQRRGMVTSIKGIKDMKITKKDKAGLVQEAVIKTVDRVIKVSGKQLYSFAKNIKSFYIGLRKKADKIILSGRGYGHHLGLCQWGARAMVRDGWNYKRILSFYYPGTQFVRVG